MELLPPQRATNRALSLYSADVSRRAHMHCTLPPSATSGVSCLLNRENRKALNGKEYSNYDLLLLLRPGIVRERTVQAVEGVLALEAAVVHVELLVMQVVELWLALGSRASGTRSGGSAIP